MVAIISRALFYVPAESFALLSGPPAAAYAAFFSEHFETFNLVANLS